MSSDLRNIVILAHADAGKTTLTEQLLLRSGDIRRAGAVDQGTAQTDFLPVEKERGISVRSAHVSFTWKSITINLIDTPGHVDFSADVERVLCAADAAVLLVSAVEGVQAHTITLWTALRQRKIPVLFFINKIDRMGADTSAAVMATEKELEVRPVWFQEVEGEGGNEVSISERWNVGHCDEELVEQVVTGDELLLGKFLEGETISFEELDHHMIRMIRSCECYPVLAGSAKLGLGVDALLDFMANYFPAPEGDPLKPLSALVFGMNYDKILGKMAHVRVFNGSISSRDAVFNASRQTGEKVTQVKRIRPGKYDDMGRVEAGQIAGIGGLVNTQIGDLLGIPDHAIPEPVKLSSPLLIVQVKPVNPKDYAALAEAMQELNTEDPSLEFDWLREEQELQVKIMGWIQMEVLERILSDRFGLAAKFENPMVIYKETPAMAGEGFVRYWMPKPCWAILKFRIEPGERGSGVVYESLVPVNDVQQKYQNEVERTIATALKQGIKGWEVTDLRITLFEGEDHPVHSRPGDFILATPMGIMNALANTGTTLLEPVIRYRIHAPEELLGVITSDILSLRGAFDSPEMEEGRFVLTGILPLATSLDFPVKLSSRSGGKARISTRFHGYSPCADELGILRPYKGISPLDTAKYILKMRGAMQGH